MMIEQQQQFYNQDPDAQATMMMKEKLKNKIKQDFYARQNSGQVQQTEEALQQERKSRRISKKTRHENRF